jgi:hypothetical protein
LASNSRISQYFAAQGSVQDLAQRDVSEEWREDWSPNEALQCCFYHLVAERARLDDLSQLAENVMEHSVEMVCPIRADRRESWIDHAQDAKGITDRANQHGLSLPGKQLMSGDEAIERICGFARRNDHSLMAG